MSGALALIDAATPAENALHSIEGEADLLGMLLSENALFDQVADIIAPADFCEPLHGRIFDIALSEAMAGRTANPVTLKAYFADDPAMKEIGGTVYLARLTGNASMQSASKLARHLKELARRRALREALSEASAACVDMGQSIAAIADGLSGAISEGPADGLIEMSAGECVEAHMRLLAEDRSGVESGSIPSLDKLLGPLRPGHLVIVAARPGMGKSALASSYSIGAARRGHGVLFASLEMSGSELGARMAACRIFGDAQRRDVPFFCINEGRLNSGQREAVSRAAGEIDRLPLTIADTGSLTIGRLDRLVRRHMRRFEARGVRLELVVVDYLQLLRTDQPMRSAYEAISEISRSLKAIAKTNGVAVMALAQLSREVEKRHDKRPVLSDLRDSGQIEQDADHVLFLLRQEYYLAQSKPPEASPKFLEWQDGMDAVSAQIEFILAKRRNGVTGTAFAEFHGAYQAVCG